MILISIIRNTFELKTSKTDIQGMPFATNFQTTGLQGGLACGY